MPDDLKSYMDPDRRFTLAEYEAYKDMPEWQRDNPPTEEHDGWDEEEQYLQYWPAYGEAKLRESREGSRRTKQEWALVIRRYNQFDQKNQRTPTQMDPAESGIPWVYLGVDNRAAMLCDGEPIPQATSSVMSDDDEQEKKKQAALGGLNDAWTTELTANEFILSLYDVVTDATLIDVGGWKLSVDWQQKGPHGHPGKIIIEQIDPRGFHPDPLAKRCSWRLMRYFAYSTVEDLSVIRARFPDVAYPVKPEASYTSGGNLDKGGGDDKGGRLMISPANEGAPTLTVGERERVVLKEMWLKDESMEFVCEYEDEPDDAESDQQDELLEDIQRPTSTTPKVVDGYVVGQWVKRYPHGRCIIWANGVLLMDVRNPFDSGVPPYVFMRGSNNRGVLSVGEGSRLLVLEKKLNNLLIRMSRTADANIERPTLMDQGTFDAPKRWSNVPLLADAILQTRGGGAMPAYKLPAAELPLFVLPLYQEFKSIYKEILGIPDVLQGQLAEGSQLGAGTVSGLQETSASRLRMFSKFMNAALRELGRQGFSLIRQVYPNDDLNYMTYDPLSGAPVQQKWNKNDITDDDYDTEVDVGSTLPGAKEGAYNQMLTLKREGCVDPQAVLEAGKVPRWREILKRKREEDGEKIVLQQAGKELGLAIKEIMKDKENGAGRKIQG